MPVDNLVIKHILPLMLCTVLVSFQWASISAFILSKKTAHHTKCLQNKPINFTTSTSRPNFLLQNLTILRSENIINS